MQNPNDYISYLESENRKSSKRRLLWVAVITLTVIIAGLWGWSLRLQMAFIEWKNTPEGKLVENTKVDWDKAFAQTKNEQAKLVQSKNTIRGILAGMLSKKAEVSVATNSSSTATTTPGNDAAPTTTAR